MVVQRKRHIAKTISYRILSTLIGFLLMWWVSGSIKIGACPRGKWMAVEMEWEHKKNKIQYDKLKG